MLLYPPSRGKYPLGVGPSGGALSKQEGQRNQTVNSTKKVTCCYFGMFVFQDLNLNYRNFDNSRAL